MGLATSLSRQSSSHRSCKCTSVGQTSHQDGKSRMTSRNILPRCLRQSPCPTTPSRQAVQKADLSVRKTADSHAHNGQAEASRPGFETTLANVFPLSELVRKLLARVRKQSSEEGKCRSASRNILPRCLRQSLYPTTPSRQAVQKADLSVRKTADSHAHNGQAEASRPGEAPLVFNPLCISDPPDGCI